MNIDGAKDIKVTYIGQESQRLRPTGGTIVVGTAIHTEKSTGAGDNPSWFVTKIGRTLDNEGYLVTLEAKDNAGANTAHFLCYDYLLGKIQLQKMSKDVWIVRQFGPNSSNMYTIELSHPNATRTGATAIACGADPSTEKKFITFVNANKEVTIESKISDTNTENLKKQVWSFST